ncbi:MAG: family 16 glycoside hydrolase [Dehalococcoidia bacterium]
MAVITMVVSLACQSRPPSLPSAAPSAGIRPGTSVLFRFDTSTPGPVSEPFRVLSGSWTIESDPSAPTPPNVLCGKAAANAPAEITVPAPAFADLTYAVAFRLSGSGAGSIGLVFRRQNANSFYLVQAVPVSRSVVIGLQVGDLRRELNSALIPFPLGGWQEFSAQARGSNLSAFLNGQQVAQATDPTNSSGSIGLWIAAGGAACFDTVQATGL